MKISVGSLPFSFSLSVLGGKTIGIGEKKGDMSALFVRQEAEEKNILHWEGEYEIFDTAFFLKNVGAQNFLIKILSENLRIVFFSTQNSVFSDEIFTQMGSVDVLFLDAEETFSDSQVKKLLEEIDPAVVVASGEKTIATLTKLGMPMEEKSSLSLSRAALPTEKTEYYALGK